MEQMSVRGTARAITIEKKERSCRSHSSLGRPPLAVVVVCSSDVSNDRYDIAVIRPSPAQHRAIHNQRSMSTGKERKKNEISHNKRERNMRRKGRGREKEEKEKERDNVRLQLC